VGDCSPLKNDQSTQAIYANLCWDAFWKLNAKGPQNKSILKGQSTNPDSGQKESDQSSKQQTLQSDLLATIIK